MHVLAQLFLVLYGITEGPPIIAGISFLGLVLLLWAAVAHVLFHLNIRKSICPRLLWWMLFGLAFYIVGFIPAYDYLLNLLPKDRSIVTDALVINAPSLVYWVVSMASLLSLRRESKANPLPKPITVFIASVLLAALSYGIFLVNRVKNEPTAIKRDFTDLTHRKATIEEKAYFEDSLKTLNVKCRIQTVSFIGNFPGGVYGVLDIESFQGSQQYSGTWYWTKFTPYSDSLWVGVVRINGKYYASVGTSQDSVDQVLADCNDLKGHAAPSSKG